MINSTRPLVRWHGGKWRIAPWIISHFPQHQVYVESYGGGASVLIRKQRSTAEVYNDIDGEICNLFRVMRDDGDALRYAVYHTPFSREEFSESYTPTHDNLEQARRTVVRSFMGFGSNSHAHKTGFRANSNRSSTTPAQDWANYAENLPRLVARLRGVVIESRPAIEVMKQHDAVSTLHYVDPPYVADTRGPGSDYNFEMSDDEHVTLCESLIMLEGSVVLSGYRNEIYDTYLSGWVRVDKETLADGARKRMECLWVRKHEGFGDLFSDVSEGTGNK